jgi:hypothetical protein
MVNEAIKYFLLDNITREAIANMLDRRLNIAEIQFVANQILDITKKFKETDRPTIEEFYS